MLMKVKREMAFLMVWHLYSGYVDGTLDVTAIATAAKIRYALLTQTGELVEVEFWNLTGQQETTFAGKRDLKEIRRVTR